MIRLTRVTRFLPPMRGAGRLVGLSKVIFRAFFERGRLYRISNFDGDLKVDVNPSDTIGGGLWYIPQLYERLERKLFCDAITPGCTVLDVGANIGFYTLLAAKRGGHVFSIEADPANAAQLRHHIALNGFDDRVTVFEMAATNAAGLVTLRRNPDNCGGSTIIGEGNVAVSGATIDSLNLPPIDVCKMDIEGAEIFALSGMRDTLRRSPKMKLLIEYHFLSDQPALLAFLRSHFRNIAVAGRRELNGAEPPQRCNLWTWN